MFARLLKLINLPKEKKHLLIRAFAVSAFYELHIQVRSFKYLRQKRGALIDNNVQDCLTDEAKISYIQNVRYVIGLVSKFAFWNPKCYNKALTAKYLLDIENISSFFHVGFKQDEERGLDGHAWLEAANMIVTGDVHNNSYKVISIFT